MQEEIKLLCASVFVFVCSNILSALNYGQYSVHWLYAINH